MACVSSASAKVTKKCATREAPLLCEIHRRHHRVNYYRHLMHLAPVRYYGVAERSGWARRRFVLARWTARSRLAKQQYASWSASPVVVIQRVFGSAAGEAISVARCESGLNPRAHNPSGASGLFQLMPTWWAGRYDPYDPLVNTRLAHNLYRASGWDSWVCKP